MPTGGCLGCRMGTVNDPDTLAVLMLYLVVSFVIFVATAGNAEGNWHVMWRICVSHQCHSYIIKYNMNCT